MLPSIWNPLLLFAARVHLSQGVVNPVWLPRSRSGAHADAQDDEAAAADEAFDFPRFVLPLFRDEARKSCLPAAGESISFYVR